MPSYSARVPACELDSRSIVPEFYSPHFVESARKVHSAQGRVTTLGEIVTAPINNSIRDVTYALGVAGSTIPMFRPADMDGWWVNELSAPKLPVEFEQDHAKSRVQHGDIVLAIAGTIAKVGRVPPSVLRGAINGSCARIRLPDTIAAYGLAFLNSAYGRAGLERLAVGSVQKHLNLVDLPSVPFLLPDRRIQDYIGAKVELAERCRTKSMALRDKAVRLMAARWGWNDKVPGSMRGDAAGAIAHMVEPRMFDDRLDPEFYRPRFLAVDEWLDGQEFWRLSELVEAPVKGVQPSYDPDGAVPALTVTHVDPFVLDRNGATGFVTDEWLSQNGRARIETGDLLYTVTGPPLGETVVVEEFHLPAAVNSHVARVSLRPQFKLPHLLAAMLNSPLGQLQTTRYSKGVRQKELYPIDFVRFRFPRLSSETCGRLEKDFGASCRLAERARVLVQEAKADVEALIEGTLDVDAILAGTLKAPTAADIPELAEHAA